MFFNGSDAQPYFIAALVVGFLVLACVSWFQPRPSSSWGRWSYFVPTTSETPDGFYSRLYTELQLRLEDKQLPFSAVGFGPKHMFSTRTIFGARPVYLALKYDHLTYYVFVTPAPGGLFVSSWLFSKYSVWEDLPILKWLLFWRLHQMTLFQFDVTELFHAIAQSTLVIVVNSYLEDEGLQPMSEYEERPVLNSYYAKLKQGALPPAGYIAADDVLPRQRAVATSVEEDLRRQENFPLPSA